MKREILSHLLIIGVLVIIGIPGGTILLPACQYKQDGSSTDDDGEHLMSIEQLVRDRMHNISRGLRPC